MQLDERVFLTFLRVDSSYPCNSISTVVYSSQHDFEPELFTPFHLSFGLLLALAIEPSHFLVRQCTRFLFLLIVHVEFFCMGSEPRATTASDRRSKISQGRNYFV